MEKLNCIIVEDEPLAAEVLQDYISQVPFLDLKETCTDAIYAIEVLQRETIDVIFLDIHLPRLKGIDFIKTIKGVPQIILITAYRDYAVESFELNVTDYLLKPVSFNRFLAAVNKLKARGSNTPAMMNASKINGSEKSHFYININKKRVKIYLQDILYIESKKEYISIVKEGKSFLTKSQLGEMEEQLYKHNFLRVHRSFIVSIEKINAYSTTDVEVGGHEIPIGRSYKDQVMAQLGEPL